MLGQREVILIGLGKFGKAVSDSLTQMIDERKIQLGKIANSVVLYSINFQDDSVFHSTDYMNEILEKVKNSSARKNGGSFSFIFVGDFAENGTSKYALDFAYLPYLLQQSLGDFNFDDVLGFFTFADELGTTESVSDKTLALICKHFGRLEKVNKEDSYKVPFKTLSNKEFKNVASTSGPFNRNYILITPGKSDSVANETGTIFAERIFYELFYLSKSLNEQSHNWISALSDRKNSDKNLSCFAMVQIPRINEIQKYYLKYLFEEKIISSFLAAPLKGTDEEYFFAKFMNMLDIPSKTDSFPIERASELFINLYKENFSHILTYYISGQFKDFKNYIEDCKNRVEKTVFEMLPKYDDFAHREINYLFETLKKGFENLFKVDRINGNFKTYTLFIEKLKSKLENWELSLKEFSESNETYKLDEDFEKVSKKINRLQKSKILSFLPLRPIRQKLIENAILSLPIENYLSSLINQNLSKAFYEYWKTLVEQEKSPINECEKILANLKNLENRFEIKEKYILEKIKFIENMNSSYYILPMFEVQDDYKKLLERIKNRNFGQHNLQRIKDAVSNALKLWVSEKDIFGITQNPTEFINFIENKFIPENENFFSNIEEKIDEFYDFSKNAVQETLTKVESNISKSFETKGTSLFENETMLVPEKMQPDCLSEEINSKFSQNLEKYEIPKDFTLGSVIYFKDYLFMSQKDMKKKNSLENYKDIETYAPEYDNSLTEKTIESEKSEISGNTPNKNSTEIWKFTRSVIMFYLLPEELTELYNKTFNDSKEIISEQEIDNLSMTIQLKEALQKLSEEKLSEFARDNDIRLCEDREKQEELIVHELSERTEK